VIYFYNIKIQKDEIKTEKISTRINELEQINNNIKLLTEMLDEYVKNKATSSEKETIKVIYFKF
jgi:ADP-ribosylation factor-binding protein GGA